MQISSSSGPDQTVARTGFHRPTKEDWTTRLSTDEGQKFLKVVSDKTGISTADLTSQLESGADLGEILKSKGVSRADLRSALQAAGLEPAGGQRPHHGHHAKPADDDQLTSTILTTLAKSLGVNANDLEKQLASGTTIGSIAAAKGVSTDDLLKSVVQALAAQFGYNADGSQGAPSSAATPSIQLNTAA